MATVTIKKAPFKSFAGIRLVSGYISFSSSYSTGGEAVDIPLKEVHGMCIENKAGYMFEYDRANKKIKAYRFDYPNAAAGPAVEVAGATDLSALINVAFLAWGY